LYRGRPLTNRANSGFPAKQVIRVRKIANSRVAGHN
jgi:hypothetical protein